MSRELDVSLHFFFLTIAVGGWLLNKQRYTSKYLFFIGLYLLAAFLFEGMAALIMLNKYLGKKLVSNLFLYHILIPVQFTFIMLLYNSVIRKQLYKKLTLLLILVFIAVSIVF